MEEYMDIHEENTGYSEEGQALNGRIRTWFDGKIVLKDFAKSTPRSLTNLHMCELTQRQGENHVVR